MNIRESNLWGCYKMFLFHESRESNERFPFEGKGPKMPLEDLIQYTLRTNMIQLVTLRGGEDMRRGTLIRMTSSRWTIRECIPISNFNANVI